jgi:hypothetical protein
MEIFCNILIGKLNTSINMSSARHPRIEGLTERVKQTMQTLLRCYCAESGFDRTSHLSMVDYYYNCSTIDASTHSPVEAMCGYQPSTRAHRLLPSDGVVADAFDRLNLIENIRDGVNQLLKLSTERMVARSTRTAPFLQPGDLVYLSTKGLHIRSHKCKHIRD